MADECDNLPFALALCGALVRDRVPWADLLDALREADLRFIEKALPNYPHHNVIRSLHVSVEVLGREDAQAVASYQALAIFPKDEPVPEAAVLTLWTTDGMREREARKLLGVLERKALLRLDGEMPRRRVSLHPLQADYLRATAGDLARLHEKLLHAYAQSCHGQWSAGPNDGYFFEHLPWHLAQARRQPEHTDLLLDFDWLRTKLHFCEITAVLADFDAINDERGVRQIEGALRLAAHILAVDKAQLPSQLYGRLMHEELPEIQKLLSQIRNWNGAIWLRPLTPVLKQPGGPLLRTLREGTGDVMDLALTPDAQHLISWARDGTIKMWNFATGAEESLLPENSIGDKLRSEDNQQDQVLKLKRILNSHSIGVKVFALTPDGRRGVSASEDGTITVWNLDIDSEERSFKGYEHMVSGIVVTPDGRQAVTAHSYHPTLHTWDLERGVEKCRLEGHNGPINKVVITPDGKRAISASGDGTVRIWDLTVDCPGISRVGHEASITALSVTKDGRFALSGSANSVKVWELSTGKEKNTLAIEGTVRAFMLAGSAWEAVIEEENGTLAVWDLKRGTKEWTLGGSADDNLSIAITPDNRHALVWQENDTVRLWNLHRRIEERTLTQEQSRRWALSPDGCKAVSTSFDGTLKIWNLDKGSLERTFSGFEKSLEALAMPSEECVLCCSYGGLLHLLDVESGLGKSMKLAGAYTPALAVTAHGTEAVTFGYDTYELWDLRTTERLASLTVDLGEYITVSHCVLTPDSATIVAADSVGQVHVLRREGNALRRSASFH